MGKEITRSSANLFRETLSDIRHRRFNRCLLIYYLVSIVVQFINRNEFYKTGQTLETRKIKGTKYLCF